MDVDDGWIAKLSSPAFDLYHRDVGEALTRGRWHGRGRTCIRCAPLSLQGSFTVEEGTTIDGCQCRLSGSRELFMRTVKSLVRIWTRPEWPISIARCARRGDVRGEMSRARRGRTSMLHSKALESQRQCLSRREWRCKGGMALACLRKVCWRSLVLYRQRVGSVASTLV